VSIVSGADARISSARRRRTRFQSPYTLRSAGRKIVKRAGILDDAAGVGQFGTPTYRLGEERIDDMLRRPSLSRSAIDLAESAARHENVADLIFSRTTELRQWIEVCPEDALWSLRFN